MARKLTSRALQERYGVADRTLDRWVEIWNFARAHADQSSSLLGRG